MKVEFADHKAFVRARELAAMAVSAHKRRAASRVEVVVLVDAKPEASFTVQDDEYGKDSD